MENNKEQQAIIDLVNQFWMICVAYLMRRMVDKEGTEEIEELIKLWKDAVSDAVSKELQNHEKIEKNIYTSIMKDVGLPFPKTSELHQKADEVLYEAENFIRSTLAVDGPLDQDNPDDVSF